MFDDNYAVKLIDSKFLENILYTNNGQMNLLNNIYNACLKFNNVANVKKTCTNCGAEDSIEDAAIYGNNSTDYDTSICNNCGMDCLSDSEYSICIEDSYKKKYSCSFNQKVKKHNPNKHCEIWLSQLQGKENVNMSSENFNKLINLANKWINQNNGEKVELSCPVIRKWLKCLSLTNYNPHITWLRIQIESICKINGHSYELTADENIKILDYFSEIVDEFINITQDPKILQNLKKKKIHNILYYPYCIVRILTFVIKDKNRLNILLSNVHFQNKITLMKNEYIWKEICGRLGYTYSVL